MPLRLSVKTSDSVTPLLRELRAIEDNPIPLNQRIAEDASVMTRNYLMGLSKHTTADRLGAQPTGYLQKFAEGIEPLATEKSAVVRIPTGDSGGMEIFARVLEDVTVTPRTGKYLTIPAKAASYGRRAGEFDDLKFIPFANGTKALVKQTVEMVPGKRKAQIKHVTNDVFYWLKESVTLPQDRSLLPSDEQFMESADGSIRGYLDDKITEATQPIISGN